VSLLLPPWGRLVDWITAEQQYNVQKDLKCIPLGALSLTWALYVKPRPSNTVPPWEEIFANRDSTCVLSHEFSSIAIANLFRKRPKVLT
jgi:hypothetical protein